MTFLIVLVGIGLGMALNAAGLSDGWLIGVGIATFVAVGLYEWFFDRENFWELDGE